MYRFVPLLPALTTIEDLNDEADRLAARRG